MENENLFSETLSLLCEDSKEQSNLQSLIERINQELVNLRECILTAKSFEYPNDETAMFAEKVLNKYWHSILQIDSAFLSTKKSICVYANDCVDLSPHEEKLKVAAITFSHVDFSLLLDDFKEVICDDMNTFVEFSLKLIDYAMNFKYSFYLESINLKKFNYDNNHLSVQFELIINFR